MRKLSGRTWRRGAAMIVLATAASMLGGCELLSLFAGKGEQKALYTLPANARVLVFVDARPAITMPPGFATMLADKIGTHLYKYKAAEHIVAQDRLIDLKRDPAAYSKMGVSDIAKAADADVVLVVDIWALNIASTTDNTVSQGGIQALIKVVARDGTRLWPGGAGPGVPVEAHVDPAFTSDRDADSVLTQLADRLTIHTARMFHSYDLLDRDLTK